MIHVPLPGKHISLEICVPPPRKHIFLVIHVPLPGKHISLVICVPPPGKHENKLLCCYQSGFRTLHFTVTALIEATDSWSLNINRGFVNAVVFLDLKKAFDMVNNAILLSKPQAYGIHDSAHKWFFSYLRNRIQTCLVNIATSHETYLPCGVPRGTILGPVLLLLYINDLLNCLMHSQTRMYADDSSITYASNDVKEIERCVNIDLYRVRIWLAGNKLTLNTTKTELLLIGSRQRLSTLERNPIIEMGYP